MSFKLIDDPIVVIYVHNRVIIQATGIARNLKHEYLKPNLTTYPNLTFQSN